MCSPSCHGCHPAFTYRRAIEIDNDLAGTFQSDVHEVEIKADGRR